jgi:hypothetical protein
MASLGIEKQGVQRVPRAGEDAVKFITFGEVKTALVVVVFGNSFTPEISLAYVRNNGDGFRSSTIVQKSFISHMSKRAPGAAYWRWSDEEDRG